MEYLDKYALPHYKEAKQKSFNSDKRKTSAPLVEGMVFLFFAIVIIVILKFVLIPSFTKILTENDSIYIVEGGSEC